MVRAITASLSPGTDNCARTAARTDEDTIGLIPIIAPPTMDSDKKGRQRHRPEPPAGNSLSQGVRWDHGQQQNRQKPGRGKDANLGPQIGQPLPGGRTGLSQIAPGAARLAPRHRRHPDQRIARHYKDQCLLKTELRCPMGKKDQTAKRKKHAQAAAEPPPNCPAAVRAGAVPVHEICALRHGQRAIRRRYRRKTSQGQSARIRHRKVPAMRPEWHLSQSRKGTTGKSSKTRAQPPETMRLSRASCASGGSRMAASEAIALFAMSSKSASPPKLIKTPNTCPPKVIAR